MPSWNTHALITRAALSRENLPRLDDSIPVVPLEDFLSIAKQPLLELLKWYYGLLNGKVRMATPGRSAIAKVPEQILTVTDFLAALRLNVNQPLYYVRILRPDEISQDAPHDASRAGPPGGMYVQTGQQEGIRAREVLCTFSDEPDWGMDQDLFSVAEYGYVPWPFGPKHGKSSQAPFHMAFLHENLLIKALLPGLRRSFMGERILLFFALARLAMNSGFTYWGWRFGAWAMHYLQDLTQPYHATAIPPAKLPLLVRFILNPFHLKVFAAKNENYLKNALFESAVHFLINEAVKKGADHPFLRALAGEINMSGHDVHRHQPIGLEMDIGLVMRETSRIAADLARRIDRTLIALMCDPKISDPSYSLEYDNTYRIEQTVLSASKERSDLFDEFTTQVSTCLIVAGEVSRHAVQMVADTG